MKLVVKPKNTQKTVALNKVDDEHIYAFQSNEGEIYKLFRGDNVACFQPEYIFLPLNELSWTSYISHPSIEDAIVEQLDEGHDVYEFKTTKEFLEWALKETRGD